MGRTSAPKPCVVQGSTALKLIIMMIENTLFLFYRDRCFKSKELMINGMKCKDEGISIRVTCLTENSKL